LDDDGEQEQLPERPAWSGPPVPLPATPPPADPAATSWTTRATPRSSPEIDAVLWADEETDAREAVRPAGQRLQMGIMIGGLVALALAVLLVATAVFSGGSPTAAGPTATSTVDGLTPLPVGPVAPGVTYGPVSPTPTPTAPLTYGPPATTPGPTPSPVPSTVDPSALGGAISGVYSLQHSWQGGFIGGVTLTNTGSADQAWQVTITYPDTVAPYVTGWSNAPVAPTTESQSHGATITGQAPLGPGQSVSVFVQFGDQGNDINPTQCAVNGDACVVS
jgi:hypothetical protein